MGRRYAVPASFAIMRSEHGFSSAFDLGRQTKIRLRIGVSETPVTFAGPRTTKFEMCAPTVMPDCDPICVSAMLWPIGAMLSLTGPSYVFGKAALTRCGPAVTLIALV